MVLALLTSMNALFLSLALPTNLFAALTVTVRSLPIVAAPLSVLLVCGVVLLVTALLLAWPALLLCHAVLY
jgi:hypothetical protein